MMDRDDLSKDVTQAIDHCSCVFGAGQFGFINVNLGIP